MTQPLFDFTQKPGFYDSLIDQCRDADASVNWLDLIARMNGWCPLTEGESMTVHYHGKEYRITRTKP